jgi:hypothetical protein
MAILNQGYVRELNLDENIDGNRSLDNLALGSISQDLTIFANNSGNSSVIVWKKDVANYSIQNNKTFSFDTTVSYGDGDPIKILPCLIIENAVWLNGLLTLTFSKPHNLLTTSTVTLEKTKFDALGGAVDGTYSISSIPSLTSIRIQVQSDPGNYIVSDKGYLTSTRLTLPEPLSTNTRYFVSLSNAINRFDITLEYQKRILPISVVLTQPVQTDLLFIRSNAVTTENLLNLSLPDIEDSEFNYVGQGSNFEDNFIIVENQLDAANFTRTKKIRRNASNTFEFQIRLEGHLRVLDLDSFNNSTFNLSPEYNPRTPGVFIINPISTPDNILKLRAFSDNTNPWRVNQSTGALETLSNQINIGDLKFVSQSVSTGGNGTTEGSGSPTLIGVQNITTTTNSFAFTHKLPVEINGEIYYFLARKV